MSSHPNITVTGSNIHQVYNKADTIASSYGTYGYFEYDKLLKMEIDDIKILAQSWSVIVIKNYNPLHSDFLIDVLTFFNPGLLIIITTSTYPLPQWMSDITQVVNIDLSKNSLA